MTLTKLAPHLIWVLVNLASYPAQGIAPSSTVVRNISPLQIKQTQQDKTDFSGEGRPGRRTGGGSRSPCPVKEPPLTALMPVTNWGKTVSSRPTFWFYVPYSAQQVAAGEFVLQEEGGKDIYRTNFTLPETPGFVSVSIEATQPHLEINKWYRWYFKVYCGQDKSSPPIFVEGWVQRVEMTPALQSQLKQATSREYAVYAANFIWYDAINELAKLRSVERSNTALDNDWYNLLKSAEIDLEEISREPIVGSVHRTGKMPIPQE